MGYFYNRKRNNPEGDATRDFLKNYESPRLNEAARSREALGIPGKTFDDSAMTSSGEPKQTDDPINIWPEETQNHFKMQEEINSFLENRMNRGLEDEDI